MISPADIVVFKAEEDDQHLVYGEIYAPGRPDAQGEFMREEEIRKMAHEFIRSGKMGQIDVMHDNKVVEGCSVVESFIAQKDDPIFIPGSWVVAVHVPDEKLWQQIKKGDINGFSMEALVTRHDRVVDLDIPPVVQGLTSKSEDHQHKFYVSYAPGPDGNVVFKGGRTDEVNGHWHPIVAGTHTQTVKGHSHRFSSVDVIGMSVVS